jgi:hypothetical protein
MLVTGVHLDEGFRHSSRAPKPKAQKDPLLQDALMLASLGDPSAAKAGRGRGSAGRRGRPPTRGASGSGPGLVEAAVGAGPSRARRAALAARDRQALLDDDAPEDSGDHAVDREAHIYIYVYIPIYKHIYIRTHIIYM